MKHISFRRVASGVAVVALAAATMAVSGGAAQAAPGDFNDPLPASFTPAAGSNLVSPTVTASQGCPTGSATVVGLIYGGTLPVDGQLISNPSNNPPATSFSYQTSLSFQDAFSDAGISTIPAGVYSLKTQCQDIGGNNVRVYSSFVNFASATAYNTSQVATTTTLTVTPPSSATLAVTLNAAVAPASAGSVQFFDGAASLGTDNTAPFTATTGPNTEGATKNYSAVFTPSDPATLGSTGSVTYTIPGFTGVQASYNLTTSVAGGALTLTIANPNVALGALVYDSATGKLVSSGGSLNAATLIDLRAANPGWNVSGQTSNFSGGGDVINGANLGWVPSVISVEDGMTVVAGASVAGAGGVAPGDPSVAGLKTSRTLASAAAGFGRGTAQLGGTVQLSAPTSTSPASYSATLTLTAI